MVINLGSKLLTTSLIAISTTVMLTSEMGYAQTPPPKSSPTTSFHCIRQGNDFATVARRGNRTTSPIITWSDTSFGPQFTPEDRCKTVSQRLSNAFASRAGRAGTLKITHGTVGTNSVICYIKTTQEKCNFTNLLLTLKRSERGQEKEILNQLLNFSVTGSKPPLTRSNDNRDIIELGTQINKAFEVDDVTQTGTNKN
ncbi:MAG: COP23 domain-containing protein [Goleter apudmare HA4340-LM2]|jgi:hypothetical protein|nr:COP23 domain-containing protein [Goleter apudmare HA4340-LM2]